MLEVKSILSKEPYYQAKYKVDYKALLECRDERYIQSSVNSNLASQLAQQVLKRSQVEQLDAPEGREFRVLAYIYSRQELIDLLTKAFTEGRLISNNLSLP